MSLSTPQHSKSAIRNSKSPLRFSVLICTYNRAELLAQCLDALIRRTHAKPDEIVIVNGGDERADEVVRQYRPRTEDGRQTTFGQPSAVGRHSPSVPGRPEIKLINTVNKNLAASRNIGLAHCTGDIVAMTDDDAEVFPDWITQLRRLHEEHAEAGAIGGAVIGADSDSLISRLADRVTFNSPAAAGYVRTLPGVNISYKRAALARVGEQDEPLFRGEDVDFNWRIKQLGFEIYYDPSVRVLHHHRPTLRKFLHQHYMYGRAYFLVRQKWPAMYCVYPHGLRTIKDAMKIVNFFLALLYQPFTYGLTMERVSDKFMAPPILFMTGIAWRSGMLREMLSSRKHAKSEGQGAKEINSAGAPKIVKGVDSALSS